MVDNNTGNLPFNTETTDRGDGTIAQWATGGVCDAHVDGLCTTASIGGPNKTIYNFNNDDVCQDSGDNSAAEGTYYMCEFRGGNTVDAYCSNRMTFHTVDHIDRDISNNKISNLRWATKATIA